MCRFITLNHITLTTLAVALLASMHGASAAPWWSSQTITRQVLVAYGDLNLVDPDDAQIMLGRLHKAAVHACGGSPTFDQDYAQRPLQVRHRFDQCVADAVGGAVAQLNAPSVSRAYAGINSPLNERIAQH